MSELKPCSVCGSTRVEMVAVRPWLSLREQQAWEPFCHDCDVAGYLGSEQARIDAWNRRPIEDELRAKLKIAREALAEIERGGCGTMCDDHPEGHHYLSCPWVVATHALARIRE